MVRDDGALAVKFTDEAIATKDNALAASGLISRVSTAAEQANAVEAQRALRAAISAAEKSRVEVKAPVLEFGKAIDAKAKEYKAELEAEEMRVGKLVGDFQQLEIAKAKAAEAARLLEQQKLEAERQAEIRRLAQEEAQKLAEIKRQEDERKAALAKQEAEAAKAQREAAAKAEAAKAPLQTTAEVATASPQAALAKQEAEAAKAEADRLQAALETERAKQAEIQRDLDRQKELAQAQSLQAMEATHERYNDQSAAVAERPAAAPSRVAGQRVIEDYEITVTDIHTLARCHPGCVKIEPRLAEIKAQLRLGVKFQGISVAPIVKSTVSAGRQPAMLNV